MEGITAVLVAVPLGARLRLPVADLVAAAVSEPVLVLVTDADGVLVWLAVLEGLELPVPVPVWLGLLVPVPVWLALGLPVPLGVPVPLLLAVPVCEADTDAVLVEERETLTVAVLLPVPVSDCVGLAVLDAVIEPVTLAVLLPVRLGVPLTVGVRVTEGVAVLVWLTGGVRVPDCVGLRVELAEDVVLGVLVDAAVPLGVLDAVRLFEAVGAGEGCTGARATERNSVNMQALEITVKTSVSVSARRRKHIAKNVRRGRYAPE